MSTIQLLVLSLFFMDYSDEFWLPDIRVVLKNHETFEVAPDGESYDEEKENEMIKPEDLKQIESLSEDAHKFGALHAHVERFNRRAVGARRDARDVDFIDPTLLERIKEINILDDPVPYTAGYRHEFIKLAKRRKRGNEDDFSATVKQEDLLETMRPRDHSIVDKRPVSSSTPNTQDYLDLESTSIGFEAPTQSTNQSNIDFELTTVPSEETADEEEYDYEKFKAEYYQQLEDMNVQNLTHNFTNTEEAEETPGDALKKIVEFKIPRNCTREELTQIGAKAFECLMFDYQHAKNESDVKRVLARGWMVIRVWCFIYICIAIPAWCQKGWCCCCFRCEFCFPLEKIEYSKTYFAKNPPGVFRGAQGDESYVPSAFELEAYEELESAIRNL
ncbi:uncharacterized protein LOC135164949 [Diachasmimorpha longicaudata]|uniref:uncharacterized protein LOC135164949 n=1 Tax=Diachasmimorpha longicaudata TaxID=58733 RepID=UPI0030B8EB11